MLQLPTVKCFPQQWLKRRVWSRLSAMLRETEFSILRYREGIPVFAACTRCQLKFLTPSGIQKSQMALDYLQTKFLTHKCATATALAKERRRDPLHTLEFTS